MKNIKQELLTDFYELTMGQVYFNEKKHEQIAYFDMFFRTIPDDGGYVISSGLRNLVEFIKDFKFEDSDIAYLRSLNVFSEDYLSYLFNMKLSLDIFALPDGTVCYPYEPIVTVKGPLLQAQIIETILLIFMNYSSLVATKASRICFASRGRAVMEFGARRAQGTAAAIEGAADACIAGCAGTSNTLTGAKYNVPVLGTMAHSLIQSYADEYDAFAAYAKAFPDNCVLLIDTYSTLKSGIVNAIKVHENVLKPMGKELKGVRLDSGDLAYLAKEVRKILDNHGLKNTKIVCSNSLDEYKIDALFDQGAPIDSFGVGENLITSKTSPVFGGVYKLVATEEKGKIVSTIKISDNIEKITNPSYKKLYRFYDKKTGFMIGDVLALAEEVIDKKSYTLTNHLEPWHTKKITDFNVVELQKQIFVGGKLVYKVPTIAETTAYCSKQKTTMWDEIKRLVSPHKYFMNLSDKLFALKKKMLEDLSAKNK